MAPNREGDQRRESGARAPTLAVGLAAILVAMASSPPVFERWLAFGPLQGGEPLLGWCLAALLGLCGLLLASLRSRVKARYAALLLGALLVVGSELGVRLVGLHLAPSIFAAWSDDTQEKTRNALLYRAHPFLQYTGSPGVAHADFVFNAEGFADRDHATEKPEGVVRVACLGESTTESGYPQRMETWLDARNQGQADFEVFNFGLGGWTTAHSLVNYALNVSKYEPDYVVIHHAWNDHVARGFGTQARSDYSHALQPVAWGRVEQPPALARLALYRLFARPQGYLPTGIPRPNSPTQPGGRYGDPADLRWFRRNIESIMALARAQGARIVLTTLPRSQDPGKMGSDAAIAASIDECNRLLRTMAGERTGELIFVDIDAVMTGQREEEFADLAHTTEEGRRFVAAMIGQAILADWQRRGNPGTVAPTPP